MKKRTSTVVSTRSSANRTDNRRRGATAVFVVVTMPVMIGMAALTVDVSVLHNTRADLQRSADAAAHAAANAYLSNAMLAIRLGKSDDFSTVKYEGMRNVKYVEKLNGSFGSDYTFIETHDIEFGYLDLDSADSALDTAADPSKWNAVKVTVRRSREGQNSPVSMWFSRFFGHTTSDVTASAIAAADDRIIGYDSSTGGAATLPISMDRNEYDNQLAAMVDNYTAASDGISSGGDGIPEVIIFPEAMVPGNFGLLNVGIPSSSTTELERQIAEGISPAEFELETGSDTLIWSNDDGSENTYDVTGTPGLKAALDPDFSAHVGQVVSFFVHDQVVDNGSNSTFTLSGIRFGRVVEVLIQGKKDLRGIWIQPVAYSGPGVITGPGAPSWNGVAGQLVLAR